MDAVDLRVEAVLADGFAEAHGLPLEDPDDACACGHIRDLHDGLDVRTSRQGCSVCGCDEFEEKR